MIKKRVFNIISKVMRAPFGEINEDSSPDTVENWDSLQHMSLILALEEEFSVRFTDEQIIKLVNAKLIAITIEELLSMKEGNI